MYKNPVTLLIIAAGIFLLLATFLEQFFLNYVALFFLVIAAITDIVTTEKSKIKSIIFYTIVFLILFIATLF